MDHQFANVGMPLLPTDYKSLKQAVHAYEKAIITDSLKVNSGDKRKVARLLGISISSLYRKIGEPVPKLEAEEVEV